jgi:hypothetical protein
LETSSLIQVLAAAHLSYRIEGIPQDFSNRGGIMMVAPPENFKTVMASCLRQYSNAMVLGDITTSQLAKIRDEIAVGRWRTLVFPEFEKLYKRDESTASNVEGHLQQLIEEGFGHAAFEDKSSFVRTAKCLVVGALVESKYRRLWPEWQGSGFARRWLWCHFILEDPTVILKAITEWKPLKLAGFDELPGLPVDPIAWNVTRPEAIRLREYLGDADAKSSAFILLQKILCVLKWKYRTQGPDAAKKQAWVVMKDFAECLNVNGGAKLRLPMQL